VSFIITLYVREGIVMASDSRLTLNTTQQQPGQQQVVQLAVGQSDSNYKTFLAPNAVGISTYGAADIGGVPIGGFVESFMREELVKGDIEVDDVARRLLTYFAKQPGPPAVYFYVAGYKTEDDVRVPHIWLVDVSAGTVDRKNQPDMQGASWGGEIDILTRLIQPLAELDAQGKVKQQLPTYQIPWQFFTLQDAIDYAIYAVRTTIDSMRFQPRAKTVGGPIDVLVIKPAQAFWVQHKELRGETL
jgi:hypothetical protein